MFQHGESVQKHQSALFAYVLITINLMAYVWKMPIYSLLAVKYSFFHQNKPENKDELRYCWSIFLNQGKDPKQHRPVITFGENGAFKKSQKQVSAHHSLKIFSYSQFNKRFMCLCMRFLAELLAQLKGCKSE